MHRAKQPEPEPSLFGDDDDGWQDMPVVRDDFANGLDEEDRKKYHYVTPAHRATENATGHLIDFDDRGQEWREKLDENESEYTRLRLTEEDDNDEVHLRTRYLFDEDKAMTPLSQMQATKNMLTEAQRIAYVGLCALVSREMSNALKLVKAKELKPATESLELWALKIMGRLYYHMELETAEQKMIESLALHGVRGEDLVPSLMTTRTVANPEYDPAEARRQEVARDEAAEESSGKSEEHHGDAGGDAGQAVHHATPKDEPRTPTTAKPLQTTANVLAPTAPVSVPGVSTSLSAADKDVTLDIRWTVLCDLFLILIADSVYDARSRVLLETVAEKLGLGWLDVVKFELRVTEALEIQEGVERLEQKEVIEKRMQSAKRRRYAMMGLATIGGGLVIGLSAGLLAPVIGAGLGAAFTTIGVTGTTGFLAGAGGAAVITTAGTLTGSGIAVRGMARRTQQVRTFDLLPLHNNKRVNCILTVSGFMTSAKDDVRLPFSVLDPIAGDVFSVLWEPEMMGEMGSALRILTSEVLSQVSTTVLQATVMTALMSALQWPILLTKLGYLIDNPWNNALDRARAAGNVLADVLIRRHLGVRPITLIGFSLGARMIFYCLLELARQKAFGIVQDVFILGATLTASRSNWLQARSVVSGRFVNGYARNDWVLNYLFRATSGGLNNIAGLRPVQNVPGLENVDVTDKIAGHMSYRAFMPLILDQLGFPVSADYFDEPEEPDMQGDRMVVREQDAQPEKRSWFSRKKKPATPKRTASGASTPTTRDAVKSNTVDDGDLPERLETRAASPGAPQPPHSPPSTPQGEDFNEPPSAVPKHAGFDLAAIKEVIDKEGTELAGMHAPVPRALPVQPPSLRSESAPPPLPSKDYSASVHSAQRSSLDSVSTVSAREPEVGPSSSSRLADAFSRSLSLDDANAATLQRRDAVGSQAGIGVSQYASSSSLRSNGRAWQRDTDADEYAPYAPSVGFSGTGSGVSASLSSAARDHAAPVPSQSALSFGGADGSIWGSDLSSASTVQLFDAKDSLNGGFTITGDPLSFGQTSNGTSTSRAPLGVDPFAFAPAGTISFGGLDGTVRSTADSGVSDDGWSRPALGAGRTRSTSSVLNPWQ